MNPYLIIALETSAKLLLEEVKKFTKSEYENRPDPARFSMREVCAHLADWEPIMLTRIQGAVQSPGCTLVAYDEGKRAVENRYDLTDPYEQIDKFYTDRITTIEYLKSLSLEDLQRTTIHPERGVLRAVDVASTLVCHDLNHLEQLKSMHG